jgi:hypothetical protein
VGGKSAERRIEKTLKSVQKEWRKAYWKNSEKCAERVEKGALKLKEKHKKREYISTKGENV